MYELETVCEIIEKMDILLRKILPDKKLWEQTFIKKQIDKRNRQEKFTIGDHVRGMVYSMLSSSSAWTRMDQGIDEPTGQILPIDKIFHEYDIEFLLSCSSEKLTEEIKAVCGGTQSTRKQMDALIQSNIPKLIQLEEQYGSIDICYQKYIDIDKSLKMLVQSLSAPNFDLKMNQMGEALVAEYLRNVGYDIAKPDRHIRRILGYEILGCSDKEIVPVFETFDIVKKIAEFMHKPIAEVDYILWTYCAKGYGEICTKGNPKCKNCSISEYCTKNSF